MTVTTDALIPALEDAREAHAAVIERFRADMTVTPAGLHQQTLERHIADAQDHIARLQHHVRAIRPRRPLRDTAEMAGSLADGALRATRLPLEIGTLIAGGILRGGHQATERQLLANAKDEYAAAARALAACRAGETIATLVGDQEAAALLASLRRQDERLLQAMEQTIDEQARTLAAARADTSRQGQPADGFTGATVRVVRTAIDRLREAAQTGGEQTRRTAVGAAREMPNATRMAEQVQGAVTRDEDLPICEYGRLTVTDITQQLRALSQSDLTVIEGYERAHANRSGVLNAIEQLRGLEPWPDYDTMSTDQITDGLRTADPALAQRVQDYEQRHRQRQTIVTRANQRTGAIA
ncbi:hypothetical protein ABZS71_20015 [Streptomyces sp. NPDC005393]|uniref:hypothetical protein n=1 Tax=Streptomyces sp. NPDC005393 TaxID=3157041 RepID=UPI0033B9E625